MKEGCVESTFDSDGSQHVIIPVHKLPRRHRFAECPCDSVCGDGGRRPGSRSGGGRRHANRCIGGLGGVGGAGRRDCEITGCIPATYNPVAEIVPPVALQVIAVFEVPVTLAENCCDAPSASEADVGLIVTVTAGGGFCVGEPSE